MRAICVQRCYISSMQRGFYEDTTYELSDADLATIEKFNAVKYFQIEGYKAPEPAKPAESEASAGGNAETRDELRGFTRKELLELAADRGLEVAPNLAKKEIVDALVATATG